MARTLLDAQDAALVKHRKARTANAAAPNNDNGLLASSLLESIKDHAGRLPLDVARDAWSHSASDAAQGLSSRDGVVTAVTKGLFFRNPLQHLADLRADADDDGRGDDDDDDDDDATLAPDAENPAPAREREDDEHREGVSAAAAVQIEVGSSSTPRAAVAGARLAPSGSSSPPPRTAPTASPPSAATSAVAAQEIFMLLTPRAAWTREVIIVQSLEPRRHALLALFKFASLQVLVLAEIFVTTTAWQVYLCCGVATLLLLGVMLDKVLFDIVDKRSSVIADDLALPVWDATSINYLSLIVLIKVLLFREGIDFSLSFLGAAMLLNDFFIVVEELPQLIERLGRRRPDKSARVKEDTSLVARATRCIAGTGTFKRFRYVMQYALLAVGVGINAVSIPLGLLLSRLFQIYLSRTDRKGRTYVQRALDVYASENPDVAKAEIAAFNFVWIWGLVLASDANFLAVAVVLGIYSGTKPGGSPIADR